MVNSTWTKNHVDSILKHTDTLFETPHTALQALITPFSLLANTLSPPLSTLKPATPSEARIVYPPCDTRAMSDFPVDNRERVILSIAQFR